MKTYLFFLIIALIIFIYLLLASVNLFIEKENKFTKSFNRATIKRFSNIKVLSKFYIINYSFYILALIYVIYNIIFNNYFGNNYIIIFFAFLSWSFIIIFSILHMKFEKRKN
ncbi:hypothetical protein SAMN05421842_10378 [Clostridium uliginosum]|uniref:Uncharacterized protein n=1 Tax=Clostridium uliginosum TaxID=119641 RepID=A0A1I1IUC7_9CLOT|nr:hypothetical protein SAMN05421842_10378 [Clostridium uliginosum]